MIVMESIGFAGTHTICGILGEVPGVEVMHGSQTYGVDGPEGLTGTGRQTPEDFAASMTRAAERGAHPVAVHCLFPPANFKPACDRAGIRYSVLVREPERQIESCYAWALGKVLAGDHTAFVAALQLALGSVKKMGVRANLPNTLFTYAATHVCSYNLHAMATGAPVFQMENLLADEEQFRTTFDLPETAELPHFSGDAVQLSSHRAKPGLDALAPPDRESILAAIRFEHGGRSYGVADIRAAMKYGR